MYTALHVSHEGRKVNIGTFDMKHQADMATEVYRMRNSASIDPRDKLIVRPHYENWDGLFFNLVFDACSKNGVADHTVWVYLWLSRPARRDRQADEHELFLVVGQPAGMEIMRLLS